MTLSKEADDSPRDAIWDREALSRRLGRDDELVAMILGAFLEDIPGRMQTLEDAVARDDVDVAVAESHTIKGAAGNVGGDSLRRVAAEMERATRENGVRVGAPMLRDLKIQFAVLEREIRTWVDSENGRRGRMT